MNNTMVHKFTFLFNFMFVNIEWTRHVLLNIEPNANVKPKQSVHIFAFKTIQSCKSCIL